MLANTLPGVMVVASMVAAIALLQAEGQLNPHHSLAVTARGHDGRGLFPDGHSMTQEQKRRSVFAPTVGSTIAFTPFALFVRVLDTTDAAQR